VQDWAWTAVTHPDDIAGFVDGWRSAMATGEPFEGEARVPRADGQYRWLLVRAVPSLLTDLGIDGYFALIIFGVALLHALITAPNGIAGQIFEATGALGRKLGLAK